MSIKVMAEQSGVTEASLKTKLIEQLQATHVDIEDISGTSILTCPTLPFIYRVVLNLFLRLHLLARLHLSESDLANHVGRRVWSSILCRHSVASVRKENNTGEASACKYAIENRGCRYPCVDSKVFHAWAMGEAKTRAKTRGKSSCGYRRGRDRD